MERCLYSSQRRDPVLWLEPGLHLEPFHLLDTGIVFSLSIQDTDDNTQLSLYGSGERDKVSIGNLPANLCGSPEQGLRDSYFFVANDQLHYAAALS